MKTLEDLKNVASAATQGSWEIELDDVDSDVIRGVGPLTCWEYIFDRYKNLEADVTFVSTFNPSLVSALLDEVMAGREKNEWAHNWKDSEKYDKARERLDAILRGE